MRHSWNQLGRRTWSTFTATLVAVAIGMVIGSVWSSGTPDARATPVAQDEFVPPPLNAAAAPSDAATVPDAAATGDAVTVIQARPGRDVAGSGDLIGFSHVDDSGTQVISLVNTRKMWLAVYHVDSAGKIRMTSSRDIDADFTLLFNATEPLPADIRRMNGAARD